MMKMEAVVKFDSEKMIKALNKYLEDYNHHFVDEQDALDCACAFVYNNMYDCCEVSIK